MNEIDRARWEAKIERQSSYIDFIMETAKTDPLGAAEMMVVGLMAGDRKELRLGYSIGNALIATLEQIPLDTGQIGVLVEKIAMPKAGLVEYGPTSRD